MGLSMGISMGIPMVNSRIGGDRIPTTVKYNSLTTWMSQDLWFKIHKPYHISPDNLCYNDKIHLSQIVVIFHACYRGYHPLSGMHPQEGGAEWCLPCHGIYDDIILYIYVCIIIYKYKVVPSQ